MSAAAPPIHCPECGAELAAPDAPCRRCGNVLFVWGRSRTIFLSFLLLALAPTFAATGTIVRLFHSKQARIAAAWRAAGDANLRAGESTAAVGDYRNALLYAPDDAQVQLELAKALVRQGLPSEAQNYLVQLRASDPENSAVALELARIAAKSGDTAAAVPYYHEAIYGQWDSNVRENRLPARTELVAYLLNHSRTEPARAEALAMAAENPSDAGVNTLAGTFLMSAGDAQSALNEFRRALALGSDEEAAAAGAARAAMRLGRFHDAARYFSQAEEDNSRDEKIIREHAIATRAAELDPFAAQMTAGERQRRTLKLFAVAEARARLCFPGVLDAKAAGAPNLQALQAGRRALPARLNIAFFAQHPSSEEDALSWAFAAEEAAQLTCGDGREEDAAIRAIAAAHREKTN